MALVDVAMQKSFGSLLQRAMRTLERPDVVFEVVAGSRVSLREARR